MYERFTDRARKVMQLANQEAQRFGYEYITSEHLLLALLEEDNGVAANVLKNLDIDGVKLREEIKGRRAAGPYAVKREGLPLTPCVKSVIAKAIEEAELLDHNYVGTEHLLLGLVGDKESVAAQVLRNLGLKLEDVRGEVLRLLGREIPTEKSSNIPPYPKIVQPCAERERIRSLEQQLWNVRIVLGALAGALAGSLLAAGLGGVLGSIIGGIVAALGRRIPAAVVGGVTGVLLGSAHLPSEGGGLAGALLGALAGVLIAESGGPSGRRRFRVFGQRR
jgi:hypothetical protein